MPFFWILGIFFCLINPADCCELVCSPSTVQAHLGQDVVLSCRVEPPSDITALTVELTRDTDVAHRYRSQGEDTDSPNQRFKGRTFLNHQNLKVGNISFSLTNFIKEDEGNYTICLRKQDWSRYCTITLIEIPQRVEDTHDPPGSGLGPGVIAGIVFGVFGVIVVVVLGILAFFYLLGETELIS